MKKRRNKNKAKRRRNAAGAVALAPRRRLSLPRVNRAPPPDIKTLAAAVVASVGSSVASGLLVNQKVMEPETAAAMMAVAGGVGAYFTGGNLRVACTGIAAAGAGQYALAKLGGTALKGQPPKQQPAPPQQTPPPAEAPMVAQAQLPAPPQPAGVRPQSATGGGFVVDLFRDAANDLELIEEDEWRYGTRDADPGEYVEIDLDEAA